ncbi:ABC transporter permease [Rubrolithibacter danxiaensis]|uniref:ABC transporter permease n=1 Tax=Rubrolithibacter danxiaensis TaxID=3390805 RepID=UPI003BF7A0C5
MFKNNFKIAWRNLLRNRVFSFINIVGLAVGMAFTIIIGLWIQYQFSIDDFQINKSRIALLERHGMSNEDKITRITTPLPLYNELQSGYPEVKHVTRISWLDEHSLISGDKKLNKKGIYVDPDFLKMFTFPLSSGNMEKALTDPNSVVLTETLAKTLFGSTNPIGKIIKFDNQFNVMVSAVVRDLPKNSSISFDFLVPFALKVQTEDWVKRSLTKWDGGSSMTAVELKEGADMESLSAKLKSLLPEKSEGNRDILFLHPMEKWNLYDEYKDWVNVGGKIEYVRLFGTIGIFVLLIACINFMNLATARSEKRAREVGIRKAIGSKRKQLIVQFLSESLFTAFIAFLLALVIVILVLPLLKDLDFENIQLNLTDFSVLVSVLGICIITGLIAGSYPAFYLSSFVPVKVLKGAVNQGTGAISFRKILVVLQFTISITLIVSTVLVFQQIEHARSRSIGYNPDNLISVNGTNDLAKNYKVLKQELLNTGYFEAVAKSSSSMTNINNDWGEFSWEGKDPDLSVSLDVLMVDYDYEKATGMKFKEGRSFSREFKTDSAAVVLNESAVKLMGFKNPTHKTIRFQNKILNVIGVTENVVIADAFKTVNPAVIFLREDHFSTVLLRLKPNADLKKALAVIKPIFEKHNPSLPFEYKFADEEFAKKFEMENKVAKLSAIFAALTIFISCLGLFGLAAFMAERRTKEIGIRKVLGATVANVWLLLSKEFVVLVIISCLIASPIAFLLMYNWLQKYEYRIDIGFWVFALAGITALFIAVATVSFQTIKAGLANPVKSLRTE